jgi:ABC-type multidrug transport system fused ATPase/permease subunit
MISGLDDGVTTVIIAHRLSTVRGADVLIYMEEGRVVRSGSFDDLVAHVPSFERQAALMGLTGPPWHPLR